VIPKDKLRIFVFDYDGTLTLGTPRIPDGTRAALGEIYDEKLALLGIVSGRDLAFLKNVNKTMDHVFSFLVAENGAVFYYDSEDELVIKGLEWSERARPLFENADFEIRFSEVIGSSKVENSEKISKILQASGLESKLVLNKDSIMVCPPDVDKGKGVAEAIEHYSSVAGAFVMCFGDGENDVALFGPADLRVAVANAVPELKAIADYVTTRPGGDGVEEYLRQNVLVRR
jgi:hydroxymethylpyrimidine pyrophosphatase-like HAD family hydrolase